MSEWIAFARPAALWALALVPVYAWLRWRRLARDRVPFAPLQYRRPPVNRGALARLELPLGLVLLVAVLVALAGPYRERPLELIEEEGIDVLLVLDVSLSMLAADFPPNRLETLRGLAADFIRRSSGDRIGVVIFARDSFIQAPLTTDHRVLLELVDGARVDAINQAASGGTAIGDALLVAARHLERTRVAGRDQAIVLITDGESNLGSDPELGARYLAHLGIRFYAIGVGGDEPIEVFVDGERLGGNEPYLAVLDDAQLRRIAEVAGGRFYRATDADALERIFAELARLESAPFEVRRLAVRHGLARHLAFAALFLYAALLYLQGVVLRRPCR